MKYSSRDFGRELLAEIARGYEPVRIARWAFSKIMDPDIKIESAELHHTIITVVAMEEGPEFEYSESDLRTLAEALARQEDQ
jgi:hypothetical protein